MSPQEKNQINGITWSVLIGALAMCGTVVGGVVHLEKTITDHTGRVRSLEEWKVEAAPQVRENTKQIAVINSILKIK
jgi:hypothetical protein